MMMVTMSCPSLLHVLLQCGECLLRSGQIATLEGAGKRGKVLSHWAVLGGLRLCLAGLSKFNPD